MTKTTNYQLPQWEAADPIRRTDFNAAMDTLDGGLTRAQETADAAQNTAGAAQNTAQTAYTNAQTAQTTANAAQTAAKTAQTTADTARSAAQTAQTTADAAQTTADAAQAAANAAYSPDNRPFVIGKYVGTGKSGADNPCQITVGFRPSALLVCPSQAFVGDSLDEATTWASIHMIAFYPATAAAPNATVTWLDDGVSWYGSDAELQFNRSGLTYFYIAFP